MSYQTKTLFVNITRLSDIVEEINSPEFMTMLTKLPPSDIANINQTVTRIINSLENFKNFMAKNPYMEFLE